MITSLEDHVGDILRKARLSKGLTAGQVADVLGLSEGDYLTLESEGRSGSATSVRWERTRELLGLEGSRLEALIHGWTPPVVDPSTWNGLHVFVTEGKGMTVAAYLVWDDSTRQAALFDTGFDAGPILDWVRDHALSLGHVFITHQHGDHVAGVPAICRAHPGIRIWAAQPVSGAPASCPPPSRVDVGRLQVRWVATPGHADDGLTYLISGWPGQAPDVAVVGDALFCASMGGAREKLPLAKSAVVEHILSSPESTLICPGHGPLTTVGTEKAHNPWFPPETIAVGR